jgi:hypothetical protein
MKVKRVPVKELQETTSFSPEHQRNTPEFREVWKDRIVNLSPRDIKRIDIHKFVGNGSTLPYMDDYVCEVMNVEPSIPVYEEVDLASLLFCFSSF